MIVERALCSVLDGLTISVDGSDVVVQNNMGNQDALDKFIALSDKRGERKYPLVFVGLGDVYKDYNGYKYSRSKLYILMNTQEELLYKDRADKTYIKYIEPIYQKLVYTLRKSNGYLFVLGDNPDKYSYVDRPNFGIVKGDVGSIKQGESVATDYVDARIIDLELKLKTDCIL